MLLSFLFVLVIFLFCSCAETAEKIGEVTEMAPIVDETILTMEDITTVIPNKITTTVSETNVGGRNYKQHSGSLPNDEQNLVYKICKELNVNPNMIFAIALHESGFEADAGLGDKDYNGSSTASGYMQMLDSTWNYYASPNGAYYTAYIDLLNKYHINLQNKNDPKANLAVGICCYAQCQKEKGEDASIRVIVGYYGEGYYAASTLEIIEYFETITRHLNSLFEL